MYADGTLLDILPEQMRSALRATAVGYYYGSTAQQQALEEFGNDNAGCDDDILLWNIHRQNFEDRGVHIVGIIFERGLRAKHATKFVDSEEGFELEHLDIQTGVTPRTSC